MQAILTEELSQRRAEHKTEKIAQERLCSGTGTMRMKQRQRHQAWKTQQGWS